MLKSEMQHQFWVTKKAVQRKLGTKEDECVVSSDAELDAKIEVFKSISETSTQLYRLVDQYQERLCILAQEENSLGKLLKENGKNSKTTGKVMISTGKAISYCGQTRITIRSALLRLFNELEVFRNRAIADTQATISMMEKERTEYRAALSWMKSVSAQLDPDSDRALDKFRKAQNHVRQAKKKFDQLSLDCLQKIDLLAAARCNMFSHALSSYMNSLTQFSLKTSETYRIAALSLTSSPQYNFNVLKELSQEGSQNELKGENQNKVSENAIDSDQMLFFLNDYHDEKESDELKNPTSTLNIINDILVDVSSKNSEKDNSYTEENNSIPFLPSQLLLNEISNPTMDLLNTSRQFDSMSLLCPDQVNKPENQHDQSGNSVFKINKNNKIDKTNWFQLFSELDPLSNPDDISKLCSNVEQNQAA